MMVTKKPCTDFSNSCSYHLKLDPANSTYWSVFSTMNAVFSALNPTMHGIVYADMFLCGKKSCTIFPLSRQVPSW